jgi:hypothetical protein
MSLFTIGSEAPPHSAVVAQDTSREAARLAQQQESIFRRQHLFHLYLNQLRRAWRDWHCLCEYIWRLFAIMMEGMA